MRIDMMKATLGGAWLIAVGAIALSDTVVYPGGSRALLLGFGVVPVVLLWRFWTPPDASPSESIAKPRG